MQFYQCNIELMTFTVFVLSKVTVVVDIIAENQ